LGGDWEKKHSSKRGQSAASKKGEKTLGSPLTIINKCNEEPDPYLVPTEKKVLRISLGGGRQVGDVGGGKKANFSLPEIVG